MKGMNGGSRFITNFQEEGIAVLAKAVTHGAIVQIYVR